MVALDIYSKCLKVKYKTCVCSKAFVFIIFTTVVSIIIPFIFAYNSRGFWIKHDTFYEQPRVSFRGEYLLSAITNNISQPIICNNFKHFPSLFNFDKCSLIKVREIDNNGDGKTDEIKFSLNVDQENSKISHFYLILTFDYKLHTVCPINMQSAIVFQYSLNNFDISEVIIDSNLELLQLNPVYCHPSYVNSEYNYSIIENKLGVKNYDLNFIISNYLKRNLSTHLKNDFTTTKLGVIDKELTIKLTIQIPDHKVYYYTTFWQILKWAWMQYFAIYIVIAWIISKVQNYVFDNRLVLFYEDNPLKKKI